MGKRRPRRDQPERTRKSEKVLKVKGPDDLLAVVPYRLGFHPRQSLVVMSLDGPRQRLGFMLRVDLPDLTHVPDLARSVVETFKRHELTDVLLLVYASDDEIGGPLVHTLQQWLERAGVTVQDAYRSDGHRWFCYTCDGPCCPADGVPYDVSDHPLAVEHVLEGRVALSSREELAAQVAPVLGDERAAMQRCFDRVEEELGRQLDATDFDVNKLLHDGVDDVRRFVADWLDEPRQLTDAEIAMLAVHVRFTPARDTAWSMMRRDDARAHADLWQQVLRRVVPPYEPAVACLAAFAAWLEGNGALAWCAVERALQADPDYSWAELIAHTLEHTVPPSAWEEVVKQMDSERWAS